MTKNHDNVKNGVEKSENLLRNNVCSQKYTRALCSSNRQQCCVFEAYIVALG